MIKLTRTELELEKWLPVAEFPGYEVSDLGRVRGRRGRLLRARTWESHSKIYFFHKGSIFCRSLGFLVVSTFRGPKPAGFRLVRLDGSPTNNQLVNLIWAPTLRTQERERGAMRLYKTLTSADIEWARSRHVRYQHGGDTLLHLSEQLGVCESALSRALAGKTHKGYRRSHKKRVRPSDLYA